MSILSSIEGEFNNLYNLQRELDDFLVNITNVDQYQLVKIKQEITNILSDVLSLGCEDILSYSFYMQVNQVEQIIYDILSEKKEKLNYLIKCKNDVYKLASKLFSNIYSIEVIKNSAHIKLDIEKRLLDIKNSIVVIETNKKRICAIDFLKEKNEKYKAGIEKLLKIVNESKIKEKIPFEIKKELFDLFKDMSMSENISIHHSRVFNEEENDICEYIYWYENIFLEICNMAGIILPSYSEDIVSEVKSNTLSPRMITEYANFIYNKYSFELNSVSSKLNEEISKESISINKQIGYCLTYDNMVNLQDLLYKIQIEKILPPYLIKSTEVKGIEHILFDLDVEFDDNITAYRVVNDLHDKVYELFDTSKYMDLYKFNSKYKSRQIAAFRQYYIDILDEAKEEIVQNYIEDIENLIKNDKSDNCSTSEFMKKIEILKDEINILENSLKYINENYRNFGENNLKLYIDTIQKRYDINNLYEKIINNKSNFFYKLKSKACMEQVKKYVSEFSNNLEIKYKLQKELIHNLKDCSDELKKEIEQRIVIK